MRAKEAELTLHLHSNFAGRVSAAGVDTSGSFLFELICMLAVFATFSDHLFISLLACCLSASIE